MIRQRFYNQSGFTLVEIAIVLVVVGLLISGGLLGLSSVLQSNKVTQTNAQLDKIEQALVLYVIQNGCLPCPAVPGVAMTGEATDSGAYSTGCGHAAACAPLQGPVPWVNLGLSEDDVIDPYGSFIDYAPAPGLNLTSTSMVRTPPSIYPAGTEYVNNASGVAQTVAPNLAAYVLISHGPDGSGGYTPSNGTQRTDPNGSALQTANTYSGAAPCSAGTPCIQNDPQTKAAGANNYFDDIVRFETAPVIIQNCGSNACGNPA